MAYDAGSSTLTLEFAHLPDDSYTLSLFSRDRQFEDVAGNDLDGEPVGLPSGDGIAGGDFIVHFSADGTQITASTLQRLKPLGGLMLQSVANEGFIHSSSDGDGFPFFLEGGLTVAAYVVPDDPAATMTIELVGVAGSVAAMGPGEAAVLPTTLVDSDGTYELRVSADVPST